MKHKILASSRPYNPSKDWLSNAEIQDLLNPFHAIISRGNPSNNVKVLIADDIDETTSLWQVEPQKMITRRAHDICQQILPFLKHAKIILLVDPFFCAYDRRFRNPLVHLLNKLYNIGISTKRIEYHLDYSKYERKRSDYERRKGVRLPDFEVVCQNQLGAQIPEGLELHLVRWEQRPHGIPFHDRYILTDVGGINSTVGLDEGSSYGKNAPKGRTLLSLLWPNVYREIKNHFRLPADKNSPYLLKDIVTIKGTKR